MKRLVAGVAGVCAVALLATVAFAADADEADGRQTQGQQGGEGRGGFRGPLLSALDADHDGDLSSEEIEKAATALKALDKNSDGKVTRDEIRPQGGAVAARGSDERGEGRRFAREPGEDRGGPGAEGCRGPPSRDEYIERAMRFDADKDGKLSKDELGAMADSFVRRARGGDEGGGRPERND